MFERYNESARGLIFGARDEASRYGSPTIDPEHLLLGLMRRETSPSQFLQSPDAATSIRKQIESRTAGREKIWTSTDYPLSHDSKQVLSYAAEEADALGHWIIGSAHIVLGLLRLEPSLAAKLLEDHGMNYAAYREVVQASPPAGS